MVVLSHRADTVDVSIRMELASCLAPMALWVAPTETPMFSPRRASPWKSPGSQRSVALADCNMLVSVPSLVIAGLCSWFAHVHLGPETARPSPVNDPDFQAHHVLTAGKILLHRGAWSFSRSKIDWAPVGRHTNDSTECRIRRLGDHPQPQPRSYCAPDSSKGSG